MFYRMLFAFVAFNDYELKQWDIKSTFSNANLESHLCIYMKQPKGHETSDLTLVCLLLKALYDFKQFARQFYIFLRDLLAEFDFKPIIADQSIFFNFDTDIILAAHIDDLLIAGKNLNKINELQKQLQTKIEISDLGDASFFLGMKINRDRRNKTLQLSQKKYINDLLVKFNITDEKSVYSSTVQEIRFEKNTDQANADDIKLYQQQIELLMYLITATKPDLTFSVGNCARFMSNFSFEHFKAIERI